MVELDLRRDTTTLAFLEACLVHVSLSQDHDGALRGGQDQVISDTSLFDFGYLGQIGAVPGWPGEDVLPPQPMAAQTRAVLDAYRAGGGAVEEITLEDAAHGMPVEVPDRVAAVIADRLVR